MRMKYERLVCLFDGFRCAAISILLRSISISQKTDLSLLNKPRSIQREKFIMKRIKVKIFSQFDAIQKNIQIKNLKNKQ